MATDRQIEANRLNAEKATGPRTPDGKARSSMNALKSGLDAESQFVLGEDPADFALLQERYFDQFRPTTPEEAFYVDSLIRNEWILRLLNRAEAHLWEYYVIRANPHEGVPLGEAFATASLIFMRLQRRLTATERSYNDAAAQLARLQSARQPLETTPETANLASFFKSSPFGPGPMSGQRVNISAESGAGWNPAGDCQSAARIAHPPAASSPPATVRTPSTT